MQTLIIHIVRHIDQRVWVKGNLFAPKCSYANIPYEQCSEKAIPEVITFISVIENKFGSVGAEAEKIMHKCSQSVWGLFEIRESRWHQVFEEILCLRGTLLASQCRKIKIKSTYQGTRFALRIKIVHLCSLFAKKRAQILLSDPETSLMTPRLFPLRRSRRSYGNYQSPQSSGSSRNILKRLGRSGRSGRSHGNQV